MVVIDKLMGKAGDVLSILDCEPRVGRIDVSDDAWDRRPEILTGLSFRRISLVGKEILVNFARCDFNDSEFVRLSSEHHFWGISNQWQECVFASVDLLRPLSPMNSFVDCHFSASKFVNYRPYQTLFQKCTFEKNEIVGMRAELVLNSSTRNPQLLDRVAKVVFKDCTFKDTLFRACFFEGIEFENCRFENTKAQESEFHRIISKDRWWTDQKADPFVSFLLKVLEMIRQQCGPASTAYSAVGNYLLDYTSGKNKGRDFSACLYSGNVPDSELDRIEPELTKVLAKFPI